MTDTIVTIMPLGSDFDLLSQSFHEDDGIVLQRVSSSNEALSVGNPSVILYDGDFVASWRAAMPKLKAARPSARIVLLCSAADHKTWVDLFDCGGWDLILKPFRPSDVRLIIRNALETAKSFRNAA